MANLFETPHIVNLLDAGLPMTAPKNIVFSTAPRLARGTDNVQYVVKGPSTAEVVSEAIGYMLAKRVGLRVPGFAIARMPNASDVYFASRLVTNCMRDPEPFVADLLSQMAEIIAVDVWFCNDDRNMGGLLVEYDGDEKVLCAIDFEKSIALRNKHPSMLCGNAPPKSLWPSGALSGLVKNAPFPFNVVQRIAEVADSVIDAVVRGVAHVVPGFDWSDNTASILTRRRDRISDLVQEVWV